MKRPASSARPLALFLGAVGILGGASGARAGLWDDLRERVGAISGSKSAKREEALAARQRAAALDAQASSARSRLASAQRSLLEANQSYLGVARQAKKTEADIVRQRHRRFLVTERYNRRRILFGRRLAAMQRAGSGGYLQVFLGSRTLSDLARRAYLFRALIERDANLQSELRADKSELDTLNNELASQWSRRNRLRQSAYRERARVARATARQQAEFNRLVSSRNALQAFAARRVDEVKALNQAVLDYNARAQAQAIAQAREDEREAQEAERRAQEEEEARNATRSLRRRLRYARADFSDDSEDDGRRSRLRSSYSYSSSRRSRRYSDGEDDSPRTSRRSRSYSSYSSYSSYRRRSRRYRSGGYARRERPRYVRVRVAERIDRVRSVPTLGGSLRPMSIPEIVFKEKAIPITSGGGSNSSSGAGSSAGSGADDFPASDP